MSAKLFFKALWALAQSLFLIVTPFSFPRVPHEKKLELVWSDEFDGDALDETKWEGHYCNAQEASVRRGSYWNTAVAFLEDGNLHIDGYGDDHKSVNVCEAYNLLNDPYREFNTYGVEWTEKGYTFYVNGIKTGFSDFGGASQVPEYLILSVEVGGENGEPGESRAPGVLSAGDTPTDFIVDYVRAYKIKD
mgnify:CR=1 FL=1